MQMVAGVLIRTSDIIDETYAVVDVVGMGGMGTVFKVTRIADGEVLALKMCNAVDEERERRFTREVRAMQSVSHPHVMKIQDSNLEHDPPYFVMPLADCSLEDKIPDLVRNCKEALVIFKQICSGVNAIHAKGYVHRDIKPQNILFVGSTVAVSDLGLARDLEGDSILHTTTTAMMGTELWAAPEQFEVGGSKRASIQTDIHALGKLLYHMLTGRSVIAPNLEDLPPGLSYIIARATRRIPEERYPSVSAFLDALSDYEEMLDPDLDERVALPLWIDRVSQMLEEHRDPEEVLVKIIAFVRRQRDSSEKFLEYFDKVPPLVLLSMDAHCSEQFEGLLEDYVAIIKDSVNSYPFPYAETVASKMQQLYMYTKSNHVKACALTAILFAAVDLWRFKAMDVFNRILRNALKEDEVLMIKDVLKENVKKYARLADQLDPVDLHPVLRPVRDEAVEMAPW